ncbi:MAG: M48 family metallopeptidase [Rhodospirillaceae bacterium]|nr:M48 family metallopeptidase [Rhodospirillaceae bacterium]
MKTIVRPFGGIFPVTLVLFVLIFAPTTSEARKLSFIRDAEIEDTIRQYAAPLFLAAGLEPSAINIYLVNDNTLNAFVAGGQKLFLNTGLLMKSETPGQVIGVIAHETGHIAGGHLSQIRDAMANSSAQSILSIILGGAAIVAGRADVGAAVIGGGQQVGQRAFLQYSRTQEGAADQAAMRILDSTGQSARGMKEFFDVLGDQELLSTSRQDPYFRSHPLTRDRVDAVEAHIKRSIYSDTPPSPRFVEMHKRMRSKLQAFIEPPSYTFKRYKNDDNSLESRYARAIAHYRHSDLEKAIPLIDGLIAEHPQDPYFQELKGQMLRENGQIKESLPYYERAVLLDPGSYLIRRDLARVQIELEDPVLLEAAIVNLNAAVRQDRTDGYTWHQLAIAYGRQEKMGESSLALAEEALINGRLPDASFHAGRAEKMFPTGTREWLQAQDILKAVETAKSK